MEQYVFRLRSRRQEDHDAVSAALTGFRGGTWPDRVWARRLAAGPVTVADPKSDRR